MNKRDLKGDRIDGWQDCLSICMPDCNKSKEVTKSSSHGINIQINKRQ